METYFHGGSEIQAAAVAAAAAAGAAPADGIQTLLLMNPNYLSSYSDTTQHHQPQAPSMLFFNPAATTTTAVPGNNSLNIANLSHAPPTHAHHHHHHLVGIPLPGPGSNVTSTTNQETHSRSSSLHGLFPAGFQYNNLWGSIDQNSVVSVAAASETGGAHDVVSPQIEIRRPVMVSPSRQGLSLSLSSQQARAPAPFRPITNEHEIQAMTISSADDLRVAGNSPPSVSAVSNGGGGVSGMQSMILSSKYLRAAQELLDEVINVGKAIKSNLTEGAKEKMKMNKESVIGEFSSGDGPGGDTNAKHGAELSTAQRQELQMKKAKLATILDEVEQRYRQYHHQMQIVVSSFEQAAGFGAAKSYTALALQTISKQFRCLKDAISAQIRAASKSLGEEDCLTDKAEGSSRLRYVDRQLRQQRVLQQLGMIQHHAWRPQRGLPERAVSVLRAWLFEHFLHPYPKDSDKHMLAKQTGLTRSQVSNWFINARVRLWKPMVEEMYMEEMKNQEKNGSDQENASNSENQEKNGSDQMNELKAIPSKQENPTKHNASPAEFSNSTISISPMRGSIQTQSSGFSLIRSSELEGIAQRSLKKQRSTTSDMQNSPSSILSMDMDLKQHGETNTEISVNLGRLTKDGYSLITSNNTTAHGGNGGFGAYTIGDLSRFNPAEQLTPRFSSGNGPVSLTLGLPHCENLSLSGTQQNYLPNQNIQLGIRRPDHIAATAGEPEFCGINVSQNSPTGTGFENLDSQNRNRFAAQLLPDFVA